MIIRQQGQHLQGVFLFALQVAITGHLGQNHIPPFPGAIWEANRIIEMSGFQHAHQYGSFLQEQIPGILVEIAPGGRLDPEAILPEGNRTQVKLQYFFLFVKFLHPVSDGHLLYLVHRHAEPAMITPGEKILDQLLS